MAGEEWTTLEHALRYLARADAYPHRAEGEGALPAQLASIIGANREATTRALGALRELGVVEVRDRRVHITDPEALSRAAYRAS
jgi:CRP-like cAMP-binding protein